MSPPRIFLLSPANLGGERAAFIFNPAARFDLARRLHAGEAVMMGEVFTFVSGLYFRGKLSYALAFAAPPPGVEGTLVITPDKGLRPAWENVTLAGLRRSKGIDIDLTEPRYTKPLMRDALKLATALAPHPEAEVVLLGSIASGKYVELLQAALGAHLRFPSEFVGRGDMSRGGLLLRAVAAGRELDYVPLAGAVRHGPRPPRLKPQPGILGRALRNLPGGPRGKP
jgi:hypothetical protein